MLKRKAAKTDLSETLFLRRRNLFRLLFPLVRVKLRY